ncbi:biotin carboxyl carrier protein [Roseiarcus fermentans]|uniref:Biotin carboxyl carrier protein of acetyl-CoA carboxylase n=1 Tax=Roseiarcus fermentans TaxID=1473586 RepID=A0A366FV62_9HYPH|nr:acetyl-CoA carboxylase biotin carboxyl carrier protein [Roseiarcus fermentans]RBP17635.1 biotin carboxyl carrier protein [Roseiarcus fermentans]
MSDIKPRDIEALLETFEASGWSEMRLKIDGLEMVLSKSADARPAAGAAGFAPPAPPSLAPVAAPPPAATTSAAASGASRAGPTPEHWLTVRAPNLGTFYRAPKPGAPPYVKIGQHVDADTELCLIEVMKLFTTVFAGVSGVVRQVLVEDADLVEFDQALFLIEPAPAA